MSIRFNSNFVVAKKVLATINKLMPKEVQKDCVVEAYSNGREQGYSVWCWRHLDKGKVDSKFKTPAPVRVSFSENRNSDDIVVYAGKDCDFNMQGNIPGDEAYKNKKYFRYDKIEEVAEHIVEFFEEGE